MIFRMVSEEVIEYLPTNGPKCKHKYIILHT